MLVWNRNGYGPAGLPGNVYTVALGTAVAHTGTGVLALTGLVFQNPSNSGVSVTPLRVSVVNPGTGGAAVLTVWGLAKVLYNAGTSTLGTISTISGPIFGAGVLGSAAPKLLVGGTATILNGTATQGLGGMAWCKFGGSLGVGTATNIAGEFQVLDLHGDVTFAPGESGCIACNGNLVLLSELSWLEVPYSQGG